MHQQTSPELNDIVTAPTVGWWPLASGWWVVITLSITIILIALFCWLRYRQRRRIQRLALRQLPAAKDWAAITLKLKQAALGYFPREHVAPLTGTRWYQFLLQTLPTGTAEQWQEACQNWHAYPWQADIPTTELERYRAFANIWLLRALPPQGDLPREEI